MSGKWMSRSLYLHQGSFVARHFHIWVTLCLKVTAVAASCLNWHHWYSDIEWFSQYIWFLELAITTFIIAFYHYHHRYCYNCNTWCLTTVLDYYACNCFFNIIHNSTSMLNTTSTTTRSLCITPTTLPLHLFILHITSTIHMFTH